MSTKIFVDARGVGNGLTWVGITEYHPVTVMRFVTRWMRMSCCGLLLLPTAAWANGPAKTPMPRGERHAYRHAVEALEDQWRAAVLKGDAAALGGLLSDDYVGISANGMVQTKDDTVAAVKNGSFHLDSLDVLERKIRLYGSTAVVTTHAEVHGMVGGAAVEGRYWYTRVYVRGGDGKWKIVSFEVNKVF